MSSVQKSKTYQTNRNKFLKQHLPYFPRKQKSNIKTRRKERSSFNRKCRQYYVT